MGLFDWFRSSKQEDSSTQQSSWDPNTMTMNKPSSPSAHKAERVVIQQPVCLLWYISIYKLI